MTHAPIDTLLGNNSTLCCHSKLVPQSQATHAGDWQRSAFQEIEKRLSGESGFPCVFSKNAFRKQLLKFLFIETVDAQGIQFFADGLLEFVELSRGWDGSLNTSYPLVVVFSLTAIKSQSVQDYHSFGWHILQKLHDVDPVCWPKTVATCPEAPSWSMCFGGMQIFCNMSNPAHRVRRSRNLGQHFMMIINPRERFDIFAGDTPAGRKARANIRSRINQYDDLPHSPQLGSYGDSGGEWRQYSLVEDNEERSDKCPFTFCRPKPNSLRNSSDLRQNSDGIDDRRNVANV